VHCVGYGKNNDLAQKFWSTKDPGQEPFSFVIGQGKVIKGWDEGVLTMRKGEIAQITCTPDYGSVQDHIFLKKIFDSFCHYFNQCTYRYGAGGFPAWGIMPNSTVRQMTIQYCICYIQCTS